MKQPEEENMPMENRTSTKQDEQSAMLPKDPTEAAKTVPTLSQINQAIIANGGGEHMSLIVKSFEPQPPFTKLSPEQEQAIFTVLDRPEIGRAVCEDDDGEFSIFALKKTLVGAGVITNDDNVDLEGLIEKWITTNAPGDIRAKVQKCFQYYEVNHPGGFFYFDDGTVCVDLPTGPHSAVQGVPISSLLGFKGKEARQADALAVELWRSGYPTGQEAILKTLATPCTPEEISTRTGLSIDGVLAYLALMKDDGDVIKVGQTHPQQYGLSPAFLARRAQYLTLKQKSDPGEHCSAPE